MHDKLINLHYMIMKVNLRKILKIKDFDLSSKDTPTRRMLRLLKIFIINSEGFLVVQTKQWSWYCFSIWEGMLSYAIYDSMITIYSWLSKNNASYILF